MKTLVCIVAQVRNGHLTWPKFKENVLDHLDADLALCVGDSRPRTLGRVIEGGVANEDNGFFHNAKHVWRVDEPNDWSEAYDKMSSEWRDFAVIPGGWLGPAKIPVVHGNSGGIVLFFRWCLLQKLIENNLLEKYDQIIVTRSDYYWLKPHPILDLEHAWVPNGEFHGGVCDRHIVVPSKWASDFLGIGGTISKSQFEPLVQFFNKLWTVGFRSPCTINSESYHWFRWVHAGLKEKMGFFPQKMFTVSVPDDKNNNTYDPKYNMLIRYKNEKENAEKDDDGLITWPWHIDHTYITDGMFTGRLIKG